MLNKRNLLILLVSGLIAFSASAQKGNFLTAEEFRDQIFSEPLAFESLWINKEQRQSIEDILNRSFPGFRIRYWGKASKTAWIFEEIGKELPITVGVAVEQGSISNVSILTYRESRGGEVRYPFFTDQFKGIKLYGEGEAKKLDRHIDGITGATLSVNALRKIATLALFCHQLTPYGQAQL